MGLKFIQDAWLNYKGDKKTKEVIYGIKEPESDNGCVRILTGKFATDGAVIIYDPLALEDFKSRLIKVSAERLRQVVEPIIKSDVVELPETILNRIKTKLGMYFALGISKERTSFVTCDCFETGFNGGDFTMEDSAPFEFEGVAEPGANLYDSEIVSNVCKRFSVYRVSVFEKEGYGNRSRMLKMEGRFKGKPVTICVMPCYARKVSSEKILKRAAELANG